jgi:hypothetical protein
MLSQNPVRTGQTYRDAPARTGNKLQYFNKNRDEKQPVAGTDLVPATGLFHVPKSLKANGLFRKLTRYRTPPTQNKGW